MFGFVSKKKYDRILLELEKASADERKTFSRMVEYYVENQKLRAENEALKAAIVPHELSKTCVHIPLEKIVKNAERARRNVTYGEVTGE